MSYDLMVFEAKSAPKNKAEFIQWYSKLTEWEEDHNYNDVQICCPELRAWYREMLAHFPAMNGPDAKTEVCDDDDELRLTDYCIAKSAIYCAFAWSQADLAYKTVKSLATKNGVGFFNVSGSSGEILLPCGNEIK